ncbi:MAG: phosphoglycerate kinase [Nanoarchaeota archaeon]
MYATLNDIDVLGKRVIVRVDYNVPLKDGRVSNDKRIRETLPTIENLLRHGAKVILMSHLGRPDGKVVEEMRLAPVGEQLGKLLNRKIVLVNDCIGPAAEAAAHDLKEGQVLLLENLRFHPEEEADDLSFAEKLANLADIYVSDAFGTLHRAHASVEGITHFLPSAAGMLVEREIKMLSKVNNAERPFYAILGGVKVSDKIKVINNLLQKVDRLFIGGAMMCTFFLAKDYEMGKSKVEPAQVDLAKSLLANPKIVLPVDVLLDDGTVCKPDAVSKERACFDLGPETVAQWKKSLADAKTVVWNGPLGKFEEPQFAKATEAVAKALSELKATTIIGGGDSAAAIEKFGLEKQVSHVSTGGGASLEFFEGKVLPGIAALKRNYEKFF